MIFYTDPERIVTLQDKLKKNYMKAEKIQKCAFHVGGLWQPLRNCAPDAKLGQSLGTT